MISLVNANALHIPLADKSVSCVVTSPPYFGLRDYQTGQWIGGDPACDHQPGNESRVGKTTLQGGKASTGHKQEGFRGNCPKCGAVRVDNQIGLEETPEEYIAKMVEVFREVWRVLRDDGTLWINIADSYATRPGKGNNIPQTKWKANAYPESAAHRRNSFEAIKPKDLIGIPWMLAFALRADGWYLRSDIIWSKPNPMPESVTDRPTKAHEYLFLLSKQERYYYDSEAVKEEAAPATLERNKYGWSGAFKGQFAGSPVEERWQDGRPIEVGNFGVNGRNRRTVWELATEPTPFAHFATFPRALVEPCIKAGTSERGVCPVCGAPWGRVTKRDVLPPLDRIHNNGFKHDSMTSHGEGAATLRNIIKIDTTGWLPTCSHDTQPVPAVVFDPFCGSGTTGIVARQLGRRFVGLDLSMTYLADIARKRLGLTALEAWTEGKSIEDNGYHDLPLFGEVGG